MQPVNPALNLPRCVKMKFIERWKYRRAIKRMGNNFELITIDLDYIACDMFLCAAAMDDLGNEMREAEENGVEFDE